MKITPESTLAKPPNCPKKGVHLLLTPGCDSESVIVEADSSFLSGVVVAFNSNIPLENVVISQWVLIADEDGEEFRYLQVGESDGEGRFYVSLGFGTVSEDSRYQFAKEGFDSKEFLIPSDATKVDEYNYTLEVFLMESS